MVMVSCEEVIDVDIKDGEKQVVVEGIISDIKGDAVVKVSNTLNFSEPNIFKGVKGADVTVQDESGIRHLFIEGDTGVYRHNEFVGVPGQTYNLVVKVGDKEYSASATMPLKTKIDGVFITKEFLFTESYNTVNVAYTDPADAKNYYQFVQWVNNVKTEQQSIFDDEYTNGRPNIQKLYYIPEDDEKGIVSGDSVQVSMYNITGDMHKYWYSVFRSGNGQSGQASPANPVSNMRGGALGYFSAQTRETLTIVAP